MGVNILGPRKLQKLRELTGCTIDHAVTQSHGHRDGEFYWWFRVIEKDGHHWHGVYVVQTGMWRPLVRMESNHWSSCREVEDRHARRVRGEVRTGSGDAGTDVEEVPAPEQEGGTD